MPSWEDNNKIRLDEAVIELGAGLSLTKVRDDIQHKKKYVIEALLQSSGNVRFGTTVPTVLSTDNENDTYVRTSDGTSIGLTISTFVFDKNTNVWVQQSGAEEIVDTTVTVMPTFPTTTIAGATFTPNTPATAGITYAVSDGTTVAYSKWNGTQYISSVAPATCPAPMTRAALIALRNSNGLSKDCDYVITDHVQGRLVSGTTIHLQAVSANELSENVQVNTTYDNEAWRGIYNIDLGLVLELQDNRNNVARGINGVQVTNFDWGNTSYNNVVVDNATLTADIGNVATKNNITIDKTAILNITGFTGVLNNITFSTAVNANFSNANGTWRESIIKGGGTFNVSGYTGGGDNYYNEIDGNCNINYSNSSSTIILRQNKIISSTLTHTGVSTGNFNIANSFLQACTFIHSVGALNFRMAACTATKLVINNTTGAISLDNNPFLSNSTITQNTANGTISLTGCTLSIGTIINSSIATLTLLNSIVSTSSSINLLANSTGNVTITASEISNTSQINKIATSTGTITILDSNISGASIITHESSVIMSLTRIIMESASIIKAFVSSGGNMTISDTKLFSASAINKLSASISGSITLNNGTFISSQSFIQTAGTGNLILTSTSMFGLSGIDITAGDRDYNFVRASMNGVARANLSGTGAGIQDNFNELEIKDRGVLTISCSGSANNINYTEIFGLNGAITLSGTTGGKLFSRIKCRDGIVNISNNPNPATFNLWTISDASIVNIFNQSANDLINYINLTNKSTLNINKTGVGNIQYVDIINNGSLSINGIATSITKCTIEQGSVIFNGGSCSDISKKMSGLWTINGGIQQSSHHWTTSNRLTNTNNTGRADYLGSVSTVPIL